eukprot:gnl/TRDRNA2_/TRDRNA2_202122_c0_seq1.p1 gnl/TRDRNA2_/TRDRNA2_202122_c0~~gnl/TRDRNA2_/TRDRNA2_202122_c0_seq1.p1  ORF type:complete len:165 (-),score=29.19 gnl/TRDRNA2_/TRDRNA2_202122_c0_seq1:163-657(-)
MGKKAQARGRSKPGTSVALPEWLNSTAAIATAAIALLIAALLAWCSRERLRLDPDQKVYVENQPVLGDGAGEGALDQCRSIAPDLADKPDAPNVKVCGTNITATFFLMKECKPYYKHSKTLGSCNASMPANTCESWGPSDDPRFGNYQSYRIELCSSAMLENAS